MKTTKSLLILTIATALLFTACLDPYKSGTCSDGIQNQGETGVDCGGPCPACVTASCSDGIQNQGETGIDCGGPCAPCVVAACGGSSSVTDVDGNVYPVITIGAQCWMEENLKSTTYRNGDPIPNVTDSWDWGHVTTGAYCDYDNTASNSSTYGKLYNWYTVNSGNVCPTGWHVPSGTEWAALETYLGDANLAGGKLKEAGTAHWQSPNTAATNETGFTALPGGFRSSTGSYSSITYNGYWWSSTAGTDTSYARYRFLDFNGGFLYGNEDYKVNGLSVRCIRD